MRPLTRGQIAFLALSCLALLLLGLTEPVIHGNDESSIRRYLQREEQDRVELLAVRDDGPDRIAVYRCEKGEPDERCIVRFRQNEDGNYEAYGHPKRMYGPYPMGGVYSQPLNGYSGDREVCYAVWNESEALAEVRFRLDGGPEVSVPVSGPPSLTLWRFTGGEDGWHLESAYYDAAGNELL